MEKVLLLPLAFMAAGVACEAGVCMGQGEVLGIDGGRHA
jgi:hypothetical protein